MLRLLGALLAIVLLSIGFASWRVGRTATLDRHMTSAFPSETFPIATITIEAPTAVRAMQLLETLGALHRADGIDGGRRVELFFRALGLDSRAAASRDLVAVARHAVVVENGSSSQKARALGVLWGRWLAARGEAKVRTAWLDLLLGGSHLSVTAFSTDRDALRRSLDADVRSFARGAASMSGVLPARFGGQDSTPSPVAPRPEGSGRAVVGRMTTLLLTAPRAAGVEVDLYTMHRTTVRSGAASMEAGFVAHRGYLLGGLREIRTCLGSSQTDLGVWTCEMHWVTTCPAAEVAWQAGTQTALGGLLFADAGEVVRPRCVGS